MEFDQTSTSSQREPTLSKQKHHLVDLSNLPEEMRLGQLFLQCPSNPQAKQVPLLN